MPDINETPEGPNHEAEEPAAEYTSEQKDLAKKLLDAVQTRETSFSQGWWKTAEEAEKLYCAENSGVKDDTPYNILYSNTEVLLPSLYSATPKPAIRPRFQGEKLGPIPDVISRFLIAASDPGHPGEDCFDSALSDAVLSALVPGMGYVRIRHLEEKAFPVTYESGHYRTLIWSKASRWAKVEWIAFKHPMKKGMLGEKFDISNDKLSEGYEPGEKSPENIDDCCVYEIWHKPTREVYFICEEWKDKLLRVSPDPLKLVNFFPTPGIICLTAKPGKLTPTPLYAYYRQQAEELNRVTVRLNRVLSAIRVRGAYNSLLGTDLANILADGQMENGFVPAGESALLAQSGGFDKHIWMLPIEKLIVVAQELYKAREAIKVVIYELTGISDIIRGSSVASETATAQDLKAKWGTVRLRKMQTLVANYARDLFRLTIDGASSVVPPEKWKEVTQLPLPTAQEKMVLAQQMQYLQAQSLGQPNPQLQQLQQQLQIPSFDEVLAKIKADATRTFVVNIQTSSTIDLDSAQDKAEVGEFMNAMGQLASGLQPLMALGPTGVNAVKALIVSVCQRFKFGESAVEAIQAIQPPPPQPPEPKGPPPPTPEEQAALKAELDFKMAKVAADQQILAAETALKLAELDAKKQRLAIDIQAAQLTLQAKKVKIASNPPTAGAA